MTMVQNKRSISLFGIILLGLSLAVSAPAEVMFEGYSVIRTGTTAIGYTIQRYEFDAKKKQFTSTSYLKTNEAGGNITESVKAVANDKFQPISYQYTTKIGEQLKMIDAKFKKDEMTGTVSDGKNKQTLKVKLKKGTFLSTFLGYLMLQSGYKADKKFSYSAVAEEDGGSYTGEAYIKGEEDYKGQKVFRILNNFKGTQFVSFVTAKGEVMGTQSPLQNLSTELVANPAEATKGFVVPSDTLKILFGTVPTGKTNVFSKKTIDLPAQTTQPAAKGANDSSGAMAPSEAATQNSNEPTLPAEPGANKVNK